MNSSPVPADSIPLARFRNRTFHIRTFGCTFNRVDSARLERALVSRGCRPVPPGEADFLVVNTCTVIGKTERSVLRYIRRWAGKELYIMGCVPRTRPDIAPGMSRGGGILPSFPYDENPGALLSNGIGAVQIAEGCLGQCAYCQTRQARGTLRSQPEETIVQAITGLVSAGAREIQLTAQDVSAWGSDRGRVLPDLLDQILRIPGDYRVRLGMMNPATLLPWRNRLSRYLLSENMFRFVHLPVQSGSDRVLNAMRRGYLASQYRDLADSLRSEVPDLFLATDVIVGYPGETAGDLEETLDLIRAISPEKVNITRFSSRPGTPASRLPDTLDRTKKERSRAVHRLAEQICHQNNRSWIGRVVRGTVVEQIRPGSWICRTPEYRSVVVDDRVHSGWNGLVRITGERVYYFTGDPILPGSRNTTRVCGEEEGRAAPGP